jgi:NLI interacting factor-like phosphatase
MKQNVILDLDNTLISAELIETFPFHENGIRDKAELFDIHDIDGYYIVFERPNLQEFLDWLFANYNVSIWTAASKDYALFIVDHIVLRNKRHLDYIFFDYHCGISKKLFQQKTKDLQLLINIFGLDGYTMDNTVIIDDYSHVIQTNPRNSIQIDEFNILDNGSERDSRLVKMKTQIMDFFAQSSVDSYSDYSTSDISSELASSSGRSSRSSRSSSDSSDTSGRSSKSSSSRSSSSRSSSRSSSDSSDTSIRSSRSSRSRRSGSSTSNSVSSNNSIGSPGSSRRSSQGSSPGKNITEILREFD